MGFDLTESELKATRKLHGLDKEGNIEEDIEKIKQLNNLLKFFRTHGWIPNMSREINTNGTIEAIEILEGMVKSYIEADECGLSNNDFKHEIKAMQTVLNMLKEKDKEINKYKKKNRELSNQLLMFYKEQDNNAARIEKKNAELEKKDKIIDLMAKHICDSAIVDDTVCAIKCDCETDIREDCTHERMLNCTKQYFERKSEEC